MSGRGWFPLVTTDEGGSERHYLDGEPIHCGSALELQEVKVDERGDIVPLPRGRVVRYELSWPAKPTNLDGRAVLYGDICGFDFIAHLSPNMRFRWPKRK